MARFIDRHNNRIIPLLRQFLLIPNENIKFMDLEVNCSSPCLQSILLGFDQNRVFCDLLSFQYPTQTQRQLAQVILVLLCAFLSA